MTIKPSILISCLILHSEKEKAREREREKDRESDRERERERERVLAASRRLAGADQQHERPKKYVLTKPKVPPLSSLLGYPEFYQIKTDEPEEVLSTISKYSIRIE